MDGEDLYTILGLGRNATAEDGISQKIHLIIIYESTKLQFDVFSSEKKVS